MKLSTLLALALALALALTSLTLPALAQTQPYKGGVCGAFSFSGPDTRFDCEHLGKDLTIKQIYEKGWRVVTIGQNKQGGTWTYLLIEEQK